MPKPGINGDHQGSAKPGLGPPGLAFGQAPLRVLLCPFFGFIICIQIYTNTCGICKIKHLSLSGLRIRIHRWKESYSDKTGSLPYREESDISESYLEVN
uniref:Uncharacterized protein n=1 Tax=Oryza sativa subsp. japonica TaxID=39947 RepID=Q69KS7_ORYSJ|nr:hypothetical protein [Oryza sativa Japonica Group]